MVASQAKTCTPLGMAIIDAGDRKKRQYDGRQPGRKHMVCPQTKAEKARRDHRHGDIWIPDHRPAGEHGNDHRDNAGGRKELDINLGMTKDPE